MQAMFKRTMNALEAQLLIDQGQSTEDDQIVDSLLSVLHSPNNLTATLLQPYLKANQHFKAHPSLIWLMLLRAEAWLTTRGQRRKNWGGNRHLISQPEAGEGNPTKNKYDALFEDSEQRPINHFE